MVKRQIRFFALILIGIGALSATGATEGRVVSVGVRSEWMTDGRRFDTIHPDLPRQWMVDIYYPAKAQSGSAEVYFSDPILLKKLVDDQYYGQTADALQRWSKTPSPARRDAKQGSGSKLPLIIVAPGMGTARANYAYLARRFVEQGFVVAVVDLPYLGEQHLADGRLLNASQDPLTSNEDPLTYAPRLREFVKDVSYTLDRLPDFVAYDTSRIVMTGHSSGGTVAVDVCRHDARVSACIDFEGGLEGTELSTSGATKPTLIAVSRAGGRPEAARGSKADLLGQIRSALALAGNHSSWVMKITGGSHMSYSDSPIVMPDTIAQFGGEVMPAERSMTLYTGIVAAFARSNFENGGSAETFEKYVRQQPEITRTEKAGD